MVDPHPVDTTDRALQSIAQVRDEGNILPLPSIVVQAARFGGQPVVRVHVNASNFAPVRFRGVAWVRPGPITKQASSDDERVLTERVRSKSVPPDLRAVDGTSLTDLDSELIRSTLLSDLLQVNIRHRLQTQGALQERSKPDYPLGALRETLVNALVHRSYEGTNAPTRILWFTDRLEVHSPGGPFGVVTADNFRRTTDYRNPNLAAAMKSLGYLNRFGRGIARTEAEMHRNGNPSPEFDIGQSWWTVILRSLP